MKDRSGNSLKDARRIGLKRAQAGVTFRDAVTFTDSDDVYRIRLTASSSVALRVGRLRGDVTLQLLQLKERLPRRLRQRPLSEFRRSRFNQNFDVIATSNRNGRRPERIREQLDAGVYYVRVFPASNAVATRYRLRTKVREMPIPTADPSTIPAVPFDLSRGVVEEQLNSNNPIDLYSFSLSDRQRLTVNLSGLDADANLRLLDGDRVPIMASSRAGVVDESIVRNLNSGTYFLEVSNAGEETAYRLTASLTEQNRKAIYSGNGLLSQSGTILPLQIPLPESQTLAIAQALGLAASDIPPDSIAPKEAVETIVNGGTQLDTQLFPIESRSFVGYLSHVPIPETTEVLSLFPEPILDVELAPIHPSLVLNRDVGYTLEFTAAVDLEVSEDAAAGFNVLVVSNDGQSAIELGFKGNQVFARDAAFNTAESVLFDSSQVSSYALSVGGDEYQLFANGQPLLSGRLRTYNFSPIAADPIIPFNPYRTSNYFFFGDNSAQGRSIFSMQEITVYS